MQETNPLVKKFKSMSWEAWLHRRFQPFVTYMMIKAATPAVFTKAIGTTGQFPFVFYDTEDWYSNNEMFASAKHEAEKFLQEKDIFTLTKQCEALLAKGRTYIPELVRSSLSPLDAFREFLDFFESPNVYIWVAHAVEAYYHERMRVEVSKYVPEKDIETYIGDISFPSKKNSLRLMEDDIRRGVSLEKLHERYSWLKMRGGFSPSYTLGEMKQIQQNILQTKSDNREPMKIPAELQSLAREVQELVYLRTLRTDALHEMYHLAQPIFRRVEKDLGIDSVARYIPDDLLQGNIEPVPYRYAILKSNSDILVLRESIIKQTTPLDKTIRGVVAQRGKAIGTVKIVHTVKDIAKVKKGDILVANMTVPAYILAMRQAVAFVTNEGGITCHAAIIAREMKKPCIIGTKIATKVLQDGDVVEVDAEKGVVVKV